MRFCQNLKYIGKAQQKFTIEVVLYQYSHAYYTTRTQATSPTGTHNLHYHIYDTPYILDALRDSVPPQSKHSNINLLRYYPFGGHVLGGTIVLTAGTILP
jgi:hypothetical protein